MNKTENTPIRLRTVLEEEYAKAGFPGFKFAIAQPFTPEMFQGVTAAGASPAGVANSMNQTLCENLGNLLSIRIKKAVKEGNPLPTQEDMDALYDNYDFSGTRSGGATESLFDRIFTKLASQFVRRLIKKKGYQNMSAPVTVAKKDEAPKTGQISYEDFEIEVQRLLNAEGPWGEVAAFIEVREGLISEARIEENAVRAREQAAEGKLASLDL